MEDALTRVGSLVDDETVPAAGQAELLGDAARGEDEVPEKLDIFGLGFVHPGDVASRNDEDVRGRARADVAESDHAVILEDDLRRDGLRDDPAKKAIRLRVHG